jgi:WD40 repeat protein
MIRCFAVLSLLLAAGQVRAQDKPIPIADIKRDTPVDFEKEVLPIFKKQCIACHNSATAENKLVLETPQTILKGGDSGPAVEPKDAANSYLMMVASHESEPIMPPKNNKVNAKPLTSQELGIIKLWINQGATGTVSTTTKLAWQPLPPGVNPIYAVAVTPDGQYAACGRANQVFIYHVPSGQEVCRLTDAELLKGGIYKQPGVAHLDIVQSLAFSPDGYLLASGGYQEVKLWRRPRNVQDHKLQTGGEVAAVATSADHKWAAIGSGDKIQLWDLAEGKPGKELAGHTGAVTGLRFSADGAKLFSGSADKTVRVWNVAEGKQEKQIDTPAEVRALTLVGDGSRVATGESDNIIRIWDLSKDPPEKQRELTGHSKPITSLDTLASANTQILSGSEDGSVRHWNADNGQATRTMNHGGPVTSVAARADGQRFASAGGNSAKLWNAQNGQQVAELKGDYRAQAQVAFVTKELNKAKALVTTRKTELTNAEKDVPVKAEAAKKAAEALAAAEKAFKEKEEAYKKAVAAKEAADKAAADADKAAKEAAAKAAAAKEAADKDKENKDLAKAKEDADKAAAESMANAKKAADAATAAAKPVTDADKPMKDALAARDAAKKAADEADAASKKAAELVPVAKKAVETAEADQKKLETDLEAATKASAASEMPIRTVSFSADNAQLATAGEDKAVHTWDATTGVALEIYEGHAAPVTATVFVGGRSVLSGSADKHSIVWNTSPEWTLERTLGGIDSGTFVDRVISLDFSTDGKLLAAGGGEPSRSGELKIFSVADGKLVREIADAHSDTVFGVDFSYDGQYLASSAGDKFVKVWNAATGEFVRSFEGHTHHVLGVTWQENGKVLASCGADNVIKVWNFETGEQQRTVQGFAKQVSSISFVGDSINTVSASGDKTVRLTRTDNGQNLRSFSGGTDFMNSAAATPNGKLVVGGGHDSVLWIWNGENGQVVRNLPAPKPESAEASQQASK